MKEPLYMQTVKNGLQFAWKNKAVWVFGLFAAFLGQMGMVEFLGKVSIVSADADKHLGTVGAIGLKLTKTGTLMALTFGNKLMVLFLLILLFALAVVFVFVTVVSQGAIIHSSVQSIKNKNKKSVDIVKAWRVGVANFWRIFSINLLKKVVIIFLSMFVSLSAFGAVKVPTAGNNFLFLLIFLMAGIIGLVLSFLVVYAAAYVIVEKLSVLDAIEKAWYLFWKQWLVSLEIGLIVLFFNVVLGFFALLGFMAFFLPALLIWFVAVVVSNQILLSAGFIFSIIVFTSYLMLLGAFFTVFTTYMWTYLFMKMHKKEIGSRIMYYLSFKK